MSTRYELGRLGEDYAATYLSEKGCAIVDRNWRCDVGEVDIIAKDRGWLAFVEVKTRSSTAFGHPFESVTPKKLNRLRRLVTAWKSANETQGMRCRIDVVSVIMPPDGQPVHLEHLMGVGS